MINRLVKIGLWIIAFLLPVALFCQQPTLSWTTAYPRVLIGNPIQYAGRVIYIGHNVGVMSVNVDTGIFHDFALCATPSQSGGPGYFQLVGDTFACVEKFSVPPTGEIVNIKILGVQMLRGSVRATNFQALAANLGTMTYGGQADVPNSTTGGVFTVSGFSYFGTGSAWSKVDAHTLPGNITPLLPFTAVTSTPAYAPQTSIGGFTYTVAYNGDQKHFIATRHGGPLPTSTPLPVATVTPGPPPPTPTPGGCNCVCVTITPKS